MNPLLAQFIPEARDLLEQAGAGMLALERDTTSQTVINDVFRAVHTLKGSSGLFEIGPLTRLVHAAEDLLCDVRTGDLVLNSEIVDRLLDSLDLVGRWIDALETREELPHDAESTVAERVLVLRSWLADRAARDETAQAAKASASAMGSVPPPWLAVFSEPERRAAFEAVSGGRLLAWSFAPEEDCFFRGDDPLTMLRHSPGLQALRVDPREAWPAFDALDPLQCRLDFKVLSAASRDDLEEHMRYVAEAIDVRDIEAWDLAIPTGLRAEGPVFGDFARAARVAIAAQDRAALDRSIGTVLDMVAPDSFQASALRWCRLALGCCGFERPEALLRLVGAVEQGILPDPAAVSAAVPLQAGPLQATAAQRALAGRIALEQIIVLRTPCDAAIQAGRRHAIGAVLGNLGRALGLSEIERLVESALADFEHDGDTAALTALARRLDASDAPDVPALPTPAAAAAEPLPPAAPAETAGTAGDKAVNRVLRIDQNKIDAIMNLVAELIVAKNGLSYLATRAEQVHGSRLMAREIKDQFSIIDRITQGLQVGVMSVRMMPVGQVFQRFPRLVRDIARKLDKRIELVIEGEDTEADKNVLESLADPLIHMVRNSLDHGIETPEKRREAGKPEQGTVRISARHENDFVVIDVRDDGKGINPKAVKDKALGSGLITAEHAEQMSDEEACNLVFLPGFSTKEEVSDLSGRGVGMDVVRTAVLKAGGDVTLQSVLGAGTTVTVRLPLTMAVTRIVTIECCGRVFGIPMDLVVETVRIERRQIHRMKNTEAFVLRDAIIPMVRLARTLRLHDTDETAERDEEAIMVVRVGRDRIGMVVDGFRERMEVIVKPLEGLLEGTPGFSGTALLGDGRVLLILDLQEVLQCR